MYLKPKIWKRWKNHLFLSFQFRWARIWLVFKWVCFYNNRRIIKAPIRLRICAGWSAPLLFANLRTSQPICVRYACSNGSGQTTHMRRLIWGVAGRTYQNIHQNLTSWAKNNGEDQAAWMRSLVCTFVFARLFRNVTQLLLVMYLLFIVINLKYKNKMWLYTCVISFLVGSALVAQAESKTVHVYSISSVLYAGIFCT